MRVSPLNLIVTAYTLEVEGFDKSRALARCGLTPADLPQENDDWCPLSDFSDLIDAVLAETRNPVFGLVAGKSLALTRYAVLMPVTVFSPNLRQILRDIDRFSPLVLERPEFTFTDDGSFACIEVHPVLRSGAAGRYRHDFVLTSVLQVLRFAGLRNEDIFAVEVPYGCQPATERDYLEAWGSVATRFNRSVGRVTFNRAVLDRPLPGHDPISYTAACMRAEAALAAQRNKIDTAERVRQWLLASLPFQPGIADTARHLKVSERSLRRHLAALGTSHQDLAQECQFLKARYLLADQHLPIKQAADALGFSSVTCFHRAFKRWTGTTPNLWRLDQSARRPVESPLALLEG